MVARPGTYLTSNNAGELKPELHGRTDLKQFYSGLAYALNVEPVPQGGSRLAPRTRHMATLRTKLIAITPAASVTYLGPHTAEATIAQLDLASQTTIAAVIVEGVAATQALSTILRIEIWNGSAWVAFGSPFDCIVAARSHTVAQPPGTGAAAQKIRLRMTAAPPSSTTFTLGAMRVLTDSGAPSKGRNLSFTFSLDQSYVCDLSDFFADFYRDGAWVGASATPIGEDQISKIKYVQRGDTLLLFHEDVASSCIMRNASDTDWIEFAVPFTSIPNVDLGGTYTNQVADIWKVYFRYPTTGTFANGKSLFLSLSVDGEDTPGIETTATPNWTTFAAAVKSALEALPSVGNGVTVTEDHATSGLTILTISFLGNDNLGQRFALTAQVVNTAEAAATVTHTQLGSLGGEALMSVGRGWSSAGAFYQDRLVAGGFKAKRSALLASVTGEYFNVNTEIAAANGAILVNLDTDGAERIHTIARARHLVIFTTDAEYFVSDRALNRNATPNIVNCSRNGASENVPIVENEGALIYVSRNAALIYAATYDDISQAYVSAPMSLLASHIASDVVDMALQKASTATDAARLWMVRADGSVTLGLLLRNQDVTAFVRWSTDGLVKSVCVDGVNAVYLEIERVVDGVASRSLERAELGLWLDGAVSQTFDPPTEMVAGLDMHEGASVWAVADGYVSGPYTVSGGAITLEAPAGDVTVGRWTPPDAITLPLPQQVSERVVLRRPIRVHTVRVDLIDTTSIAIGANGRAPKDVALFRAGDPVDAPLAPQNRQLAVTGLIGFSPTGQVRITQARPGALAWSGITIEART